MDVIEKGSYDLCSILGHLGHNELMMQPAEKKYFFLAFLL